MRYFKDDGDELIPPNDPQPIDEDDAIDELDRMPTEDKYATNFIGFEREDTTLQLLRTSEDRWLLDVPVIEDGTYSHSLRQELATEEVKETVRKFCRGDDWRDDLDLLKPLEFDED